MASSVMLSGAAALAAGSSAASEPLASACVCREKTKRPYGTKSSPSVTPSPEAAAPELR